MKASKRIRSSLLRQFSFLLLLAAVSGCAPAVRPSAPPVAALQQLEVIVDGHHFALWTRPVAHAKGAILLLHGRTWSALPDFDLQVPGDQRSLMVAFNHAGYTTYALDMRGYGSTPRDASGWLTPQRAAADLTGVLQWIAAREQRPPTLIGWSQGSLVAHLALQQPSALVANLVLYGYPRDPAVRAAPQATPDVPPREPNTRTNAVSDFISPAVTPQRVIDSYAAAALQADPIRVDWRGVEEWNALDPGAIHVPTLIIHGERDPLTPSAAQARLFTGLGTADKQWVVLPGADHAALLENTLPAFVAAIVAFIERPAPRAP